MLYPYLRSLLFKCPPETAHHLALKGLELSHGLGLQPLITGRVTTAPVQVMGLEFPNAIGLAAGLDKNGEYLDGLSGLGFGFLEIGTVTPRPQPGNPKPRLFRIPESQAIINRMGFNNEGVDYLLQRVDASSYRGILGINIGKNFDTPVERATEDYLYCLRKVYTRASYITVNLSSPNTPGLRKLQFGESLRSLLDALKAEQAKLAVVHGRYVPIAVKIAPDMSAEEVRMIATELADYQIDGVIATNTTLERNGVQHSPVSAEQGGLSGAPVRERSTEVIRELAAALEGRLPIIGVGGVTRGEDAVEKIRAGASLVQIYTGFIYQGPKLISDAAAAVAALSAGKG